MLLVELRDAVLDANLELQRQGLVLYTFGNASGIDREQGLVVIKPSGVPYDRMKSSDLVITDLDGTILPRIWTLTSCSTSSFQPLAAWFTLIRNSQHHGPRQDCRFLVMEPLTPITSVEMCR
jgi:L-ribulose-5-phosphate 4-epimerase